MKTDSNQNENFLEDDKNSDSTQKKNQILNLKNREKEKITEKDFNDQKTVKFDRFEKFSLKSELSHFSTKPCHSPLEGSIIMSQKGLFALEKSTNWASVKTGKSKKISEDSDGWIDYNKLTSIEEKSENRIDELLKKEGISKKLAISKRKEKIDRNFVRE